MKVELTQAAVDLDRRAMMKVPDAAGVRFTCQEGAVWITLDDVLRDIVLEAGQSFTSDEHEHRAALIYALQPSTVELATTY